MPYIDPADRAALTPHSEQDAMTMGELTYQLTVLVDEYLAHNLDFQAIGEAIGALGCTKMEMYRRIAAPYEDLKIEVNGDVFETKVRPIGKIEKAAQP